MQAFKKLTALLVSFAMIVAVSLSIVGAVGANNAYAASTDQTLVVGVAGDEDSQVELTYGELFDNGKIEGNNIYGYQYLKPTGDWFVVGAKNYITLDKLFEYAGVSDYWTDGAELQLTCEDGEYTKYTFTYEELTDRDNYFYPDTEATGLAPLTPREDAPTVIAFDFLQKQIPTGSTAAATLANADADEWTYNDIRLCVGLNDDTVNGTGDVNMGKRMPTEIVSIEIIPA